MARGRKPPGGHGRRRARGKRLPFDSNDGPTEREFDLHGLTLERATQRLQQDLYMARARGARSVIVVTGRGWNSHGGQSILRPGLKRWLQGPDGKALGVHSLESIAKGGAWRVHLLPVGQTPP